MNESLILTQWNRKMEKNMKTYHVNTIKKIKNNLVGICQPLIFTIIILFAFNKNFCHAQSEWLVKVDSEDMNDEAMKVCLADLQKIGKEYGLNISIQNDLLSSFQPLANTKLFFNQSTRKCKI